MLSPSFIGGVSIMWHKRWVRWVVGVVSLPVLLVLGLWLWWAGIDFTHRGAKPEAARADLAWLPAEAPPTRGRILAVVTSAEHTLDGVGRAGFELTELSRAWWVFEAAGFEVELASPEGGAPPKVVDTDDAVDADYAFLNEPRTREAIANTLRLDAVDPARYDAVYVVGGKGAMLDLHAHPALQRILAEVYVRGGVISAVCHGPAALLGVEIAPGQTLLQGRRITGFSNAEEYFLMEDPVQRLGFLLQNALADEGQFSEAPMYLEHVVVDGRVLTGQNPWSTWALAEATVRALGAEPAARPRSAEERAVDLLHRLHADGFDAARAAKPGLGVVDNRLLLMHGVVAAMRGEYTRLIDLMRLARA
jgi:putative intracellular protease/amidase